MNTIEEQCFVLEKKGVRNVTNWPYPWNVDALPDREFKLSGHCFIQSVNCSIVDIPANSVQDSANQLEDKSRYSPRRQSVGKKKKKEEKTTRETCVL